MENGKRPEGIKICRKKGLTAFGGILFLILAALIIGFVIFAYLRTEEIDEDTKKAMIVVFVAAGIFSALCLINSALCFNNLRYNLILATDEKGLYDYSGFIHSGFIPWEDIEEIHGGGKKLEAFLELLDDGISTAVKIDLKNPKRTFAGRSAFWKFAFYFTGFGCVQIRTLCSPLSKKKTFSLLNERFVYYTADQQKTEF